MTSATSYNNDKSPQESYSADPATGGFFNSDLKKHDDLKQMLDSNKDGLKLEAMKRIIGMVAKGRDASELFPAVVKNVVSSNLEVKKLVYLYLVRYAEEQQDLALLSISTFQRALKDPNPLIRGCALRVLSSIRVPVIVPIMMLAIKETVVDMSPYVRKTTAHAIPKLYSLDPEQKDELIKIIEKLLSDMSTLVVGSAVMAFEEVCPERIDLIHANYRKLCCLLVDVEEWGEVVIINMLTRYARTQFTNPNLGIDLEEEEEERPFYDDVENGEESTVTKTEPPRMDQDHRLLLTNTKPLLQSRNAAVVLSVAQLYEHIAPRSEITLVARPLVRLLRNHREIQSVVLTNIASLSTQRKGMFEPFLKSFFVRSCDPTHIKILKLEVMTNVATENNIAQILREFQTYISSPDKEFVAAAIQAIGRCATKISDVTDSCLSGLVTLLSHRDELVVGESVIVVRKLLQNETVGHTEIISHMARLVDTIKMPSARASILWLLGEFCDKVPKIAPDVLRKMAKSFINEEDVVKLQIITLATKLYLTNAKQTHLLCQYVFNLAKYDANYDIRDRARFIRALIFTTDHNQDNRFSQQAKKIFLGAKPPPISHSTFEGRDQFQLGTLSHLISAKANGYEELPGFPDVVPDSSVRNAKDEAPPTTETKSQRSQKSRSFYSDNESSEQEDSEEQSSSEDSDGSSSEASSQEESSSEPEEESSSEYTSEEDSDGSSSDEEAPPNTKPQSTETKARTNLDLLLEIDDCPPCIDTPVLTPSLGGLLTPGVSSPRVNSAAYVPTEKHEILNRISGGGLCVLARFTRSPHLYSTAMTSIELTFTNSCPESIANICVGAKRLGPAVTMHEFAAIPSLGPGASLHGTLGIDFCDSIQPANFDIVAADKTFAVSITPNIGELLQPWPISEAEFNLQQTKLRGMNEHAGDLVLPSAFTKPKILIEKLYQCANMLQVPCSETGMIKFSAQTVSQKCVVLVKIMDADTKGNCKTTINSEMMIVTSMLYKHIESFLNK